VGGIRVDEHPALDAGVTPVTVWTWLREQWFGPVMSEADRLLYEGSQARAAAEHAEAKRVHDATGEHQWIDVTTHGDSQVHCMCTFCGAERWIEAST